MISNFIPQPYPLHLLDGAGRTCLVIGWDNSDGHLCPVVVLADTASSPKVVDPRAAYFVLTSAGCSCG